MTGKTWTLLAAILGSGIVFLDSTIVTVAQRRMGEELGPHSSLGVLEGLSYVYNGYLLTLSALLILAGALNDYYGRRRMFAIGLVAFGATSVLCGLAPNLELLALARVAQGVAGALLVPSSLSLITATFTGAERARAFGVWAAASAATTTLGQPVGGLLVDTISWRVAFLINAPIVALALYATLRHVAETRNEEASGHFDWLGAAVIAMAVGGLTFGAIRGEQTNWADPVPFVSLGVGAVALIAFPVLMARSRNPLVPLELFRSRNFTVTNISTFLIYGALYVSFQYQALFLLGTLGYSSFAVGLAGLPVGVALALFSARIGTLAGRVGARAFMAVGPAIMTAGVLWFARVPHTSEPWQARLEEPASLVPPIAYLIDFLPGSLLFAIGLTLLVAPLTATLMESVSVARSGLASAINNAISRVGPQLAGAVIFVALTGAFYTGMAERVPGLDTRDPAVRRLIPPLAPPAAGVPPPQLEAAREASTDAFHLAMVVSAALLAAGAVVNAIGIQRAAAPERQGSRASADARRASGSS